MADPLIEALIAEGKIDGEGAFTLDRDQARAKMRAYQLSDPLHYLLHWVEAAVAQGATQLAFEFDTDDVRLVFDGPPFTLDDLEHLYGALFMGGRGRQARRHLAIGLNAAMGLNPKYIRLRSGGVELEMRPEAPDEYGASKRVIEGTEIHLRERIQIRSLLKLISHLRGVLAEEKLLRRHARFSAVPITIGGELISAGFTLPPCWLTDEVDVPRGLVGIVKQPIGDPLIYWISNGAWVTGHRAPDLVDDPAGFPQGFFAVVDASDLPRDVAQTDLIRGPAYEAVMEGLRKAGRALAARWVGEIVDPTAGHPAQDYAHALLVAGGAAHAQVVRYGESLAGALCAMPRFRSTTGEWLSVASLVAHAPVRHALEDGPDVMGVAADDGVPVVLASHADVEVLRALYGDPVVDATVELVAAQARERRRLRWRERVARPTLTQSAVMGRAPIESKSTKGEVGLTGSLGDIGLVRYIVQGGLLAESRLELPLPGLEVVFEAPLSPTPDYDGVVADTALAEAIDALVNALPGLIGQLAEARFEAADWAVRQRQIVREYLWVATQHGGLRRAFMEAFGAERQAAFPPPENYVGLEGTNLREALGLVRGGTPTPTAEIALFSTATGGQASLAQIATWLDADRSVGWVPANRPPCSGLWRPILRLTVREHTLLARLLRTDALVDESVGYQARLDEQRFRAQPETPVEVGVTGVRARFEVVSKDGPEIQGEIALVIVGRRDDREVPVQLFKHGRALFETALSFPIRQLQAAVAYDGLQPGPAWRGNPQDPALHAVRVALGTGVRRLLGVLDSATSPGPMHRRLLMDLLALVFPSYPMRRSYDLLIERRDAPDAEAEYRALLELHAICGTQRIDKALERLLSKGTTPTGELVRRVLKVEAPSEDALDVTFAILGGDPFTGGDAPLYQRILTRCPALADLHALTGLDGSACLDDVAKALVIGPILTLRDGQPRQDPAGRLVLVVDLPLRSALTRFFGAGTMKDAIRAWRRQRLELALAAKPALPENIESALPSRVTRVGGQRAQISPRHPYGDGRWRIRLGRKGRLIAALSHRGGAPLDVVVDGPSLPVVLTDAGVLFVESDFLSKVYEAGEALRPRLLTVLAGSWSILGSDERETARMHFIEHFCGTEVTIPEVMACRCFGTVSGDSVSLESLAALRRTGTLHFAEPGSSVGLAEGDAIGVWVSAIERERLKARLGPVPDYSEVWDAARARVAFFERPVERVETTGIAKVSVDLGAVSGEIGFGQPSSLVPRDGVRAQVFKHRRSLGELELPIDWPGVRAALDHDGLAPNAEWTQAHADSSVIDLVGAVSSGLGALAHALAEALVASEPEPDGEMALTAARFALRVAGRVAPTEALRGAYAALFELDSGAAGERYRALRALASGVGIDEVSTAIELLLAEGQVPTVSGVESLAGPFERDPRTEGAGMAGLSPFFDAVPEPLVARILGAWPALGRLPLDSTGRTLVAVANEIATDGYVLVGGESDVASAFDAGLAPGLRLLFGANAVRSVDEWMAELALRAELGTRPPLPTTLPPDDAVVVINIVRQGLKGQLGLEKPYPEWGGRTLELGVEGRQVLSQRSRATLPIVGVISGEALGLTKTSLGLGLWNLEPIKALCIDAQVPLLERMVAAWPDLDVDTREAGWRHALRWLVTCAEGRNADPGPFQLREALADLPGFVTTTGERVSLNAIRGVARKLGAVLYVRSPASGASLKRERIVLLIDEEEDLQALEALCEKVENYSVAWRAEQRVRRSRMALPEVPVDALVSVSEEVEGATVDVWLATGAPTIHIGCAGAQLEVRRSDSLLDLAAFARVEHDLLGTEDVLDFHIEGLAGAVGTAYRELVHAYAFGGFEDPAGEAGARALLVAALIRLHADRQALSSSRAALYDEISALPILRDAEGRMRDLAHVRGTRTVGLEQWYVGGSAEPELPAATLRLADAVRRFLRTVRPDEVGALTDADIDRIEVVELPNDAAVFCEAQRTVINTRHPAVKLALDRPDDPVSVAFVASAVFTAVNVALERVTDAQEAHFHRAVAATIQLATRAV